MSTSTAAVLLTKGVVTVEHRGVAPPEPGYAQVAVHATGLCGSDLHYFTHGRNGDFAVRAPLILGHESSGVITALGPGVTHLHVGQHVVIEPGVMCGSCSYCLSTPPRYNLCPKMRFASSAKTFPHLDGTLQTRMNHPAFCLHPIPDHLDLTTAALAEPLAVVLHALRRALPAAFSSSLFPSPFSLSSSSRPFSLPSSPCSTPGAQSPSPPPSPQALLPPTLTLDMSRAQGTYAPTPNHFTPQPQPQPHSEYTHPSSPLAPLSILILGAGSIGLLASALSKALGSPLVCAADINPLRLQFAREKGWVDGVFLIPSAASATPAGRDNKSKNAAGNVFSREEFSRQHDACCAPPTPTSPTRSTRGHDRAPLSPSPSPMHNSPPLPAPSPPSAPTPAATTTSSPLAAAKENAQTLLNTLHQPDGFDLVLECTGVEPSCQMGIHCAKPGGKLLLIGMGTPNMSLPIAAAATREVDILGTFRYAGTWPDVVKLLAGGLRVSPLITHHIPLSRAADAFELMRRGVDDEGRVVLKVVVGGE